MLRIINSAEESPPVLTLSRQLAALHWATGWLFPFIGMPDTGGVAKINSIHLSQRAALNPCLPHQRQLFQIMKGILKAHEVA